MTTASLTVSSSHRRAALVARVLVAGVLAAGLFESGPAHAQHGSWAVNTYTPAPSGDGFLAVHDSAVDGHVSGVRARILVDYAYEPLVVIDGDLEADAVIADQLIMHFGAALPLWDRFLLSVDFPLAVINDGDDPLGIRSPAGVASGDLRLGVRGNLFQRRQVGVALGAYVFYPTGADADFMSDGKVRVLPNASASGQIGPFVYAANLGFMVRQHNFVGATEVGHQVTFGAAAGWRGLRDALQLGAEGFGSTVVVGDDAGTGSTTAFEVLFGGRYHLRPFAPLAISASAGPGVAPGVGTPVARVVAGLTFQPDVRRDRDGDGIPDDLDACPRRAGLPHPDRRAHGCPLVDRDGDRVADHLDACPTLPGLYTHQPDTHGCPDTDADGIFDHRDACPQVPGRLHADPRLHGCAALDTDRDGIIDDADACPTVAGVRADDMSQNGCPPAADRDGDGVPDAQDACPTVAGVASPVPSRSGCPGDADADGVFDGDDACPNQPGPRTSDPATNGCPVQ